METSKIIELKKQEKPLPKEYVLMPEEKKRLVDFFAVLIEIDRRENVTKRYEKQSK